MELVYALLFVNVVIIIIAIGFAVSMVWRWKSRYCIQSQITNVVLSGVLFILGIIQSALCIAIGEPGIMAIITTAVWACNVILQSLYLSKSIRKDKKKK